MIDYILLGLMGLSFVFVCLSALYVCRQRVFEDERLNRGINALITGMVFLSVALLAKSLEYGLRLFRGMDIGFYAGLIEVVCISLMIMFFLVGMVVLREV